MSDSRANESDDEKQRKAIQLTIPPRYIGLVGAGATAGACLGMMRGARKASLQFLAENAHRPPRTVRGWYLYNKTKNYRVMLGAIRTGAWQASRLGAVMLGWVAIEEGLMRLGCGEVKEIGAGAGTAGLFSLVCKYQSFLIYSSGWKFLFFVFFFGRTLTNRELSTFGMAKRQANGCSWDWGWLRHERSEMGSGSCPGKRGEMKKLFC